METPTKKSGDATGVSRSGRVRKKSSKLTDFESPDEIDARYKRKTERPTPHKSPKSPQKLGQAVHSDANDDSDSLMDDELIDIKDQPLEVDDWGENEEEEDEEEDMCGEEPTADPLDLEDSTDLPRETSSYSQAQSLYFSEKQTKKSVMLKDGQVVRRQKAQRKDKGKSRFTAYMLWAREVRPGIIQASPHMDFSAVNKRLGELWALVPTTQKYNWKRRAKRLAAKGNQRGAMISTGKAGAGAGTGRSSGAASQGGARSNIINKGKSQLVRPGGKNSDGPAPLPSQQQQQQHQQQQQQQAGMGPSGGAPTRQHHTPVAAKGARRKSRVSRKNHRVSSTSRKVPKPSKGCREPVALDSQGDSGLQCRVEDVGVEQLSSLPVDSDEDLISFVSIEGMAEQCDIPELHDPLALDPHSPQSPSTPNQDVTIGKKKIFGEETTTTRKKKKKISGEKTATIRRT